MENKTKDLISSYVVGKLEVGDLEKEHLLPENVLLLDESLILKFFIKGLPKNIKFSSETLLHAYGRTLSGSAILKLSKLGYIPREKAILVSNKHSLPITEPSLAINTEELLNFYSPEVLASMTANNELSNEFAINYKNIVSSLSEEEQAKHYETLFSETEKLSSEPNFPDIPDETETTQESSPNSKLKKLIFHYYSLGILPAQYTGNSLDFSFIEKKCVKHQISYENIIDLYVHNIISAKQFLKLLEISELDSQTLYSTRSISEETIKSITDDKKTDMFVESLKSQNLSTESLLKLYLYERVLSVRDLQKILVETKTTENLGEYLSEDIDPKKIEELYTHFLIDYNCLVNLRRSNVISEEFFNETKEKINSEEFFEDLSKITDLYIHTTPDNISASIRHSISASHSTRMAMEEEQKMLHNLFESPLALERLPIIHATDLDGKSTSLDGYTCVPMPKFNVVTLKKFETDADTYIMPYQQAAFFLYNSYNPAPFSASGGYQAEIALPLEDYNDPSAISVVSYSLDYKRDLQETILELANDEKAKEQLVSAKEEQKKDLSLDDREY